MPAHYQAIKILKLVQLEAVGSQLQQTKRHHTTTYYIKIIETAT